MGEVRLTPPEREHFEERAAIMEFDGGLSREEAEREALAAVLATREDGSGGGN